MMLFYPVEQLTGTIDWPKKTTLNTMYPQLYMVFQELESQTPLQSVIVELNKHGFIFCLYNKWY